MPKQQHIPALILKLRVAGERKRRSDEERHAAAVELRERVLEAHEAGLAVARIASETGLSRQSVYEMLGLRHLSRRGTRILPPTGR